MNRPEYLLDIPAAEYFQASKEDKYLRSHQLHTLRKCPREYRQRCDGIIVEKDTASFVLGRATHTYILEGKEKFDAEYIVAAGPINEKTGKPFGKETLKYREWAEAQTKAVISPEDFALIEKMNWEVKMHGEACTLVATGIAEATVRTEWDGVPVQTRMDLFNPETGVLVDLKTCADVDKFRFDVRDFGYAYQMAFYAGALEKAGYDKPIKCYLVAVEKKEPYRVAVVHITPATIGDLNHFHMGSENWRDDNDAMIAELKKYAYDHYWPTRYEQIITM